MQTPLNALILAAGLGTRMKSRTAKVLHRAGGRTLIEHVVRAAAAVAGPENVVTVVGHQAERVREAAGDYGIRFALQSEQRGTGHAVMAAWDELAGRDGLLLVLYGDCPLLSEATLRRLVESQAASEVAGTVITTTLEDPTGYGRVITDGEGLVQAIVEQKAATPEQRRIKVINSGIYCFQAALLWKHLKKIGTDNPAGEYYLTDIVEILREAGGAVSTLHIEDSSELLGINNRAELARVDRILRERIVVKHMLSGVTVEKPETVTIDPDAVIGPDTVIGPFAQILGQTEIGSDCQIGPCSIIQNSRLGDNVEIGPFTVVNDSALEDGAAAGPYARLRLGNHLGAGARVGNFVELKKARLGAKAKSMHLTYLGDATVGAGVNIGAGTITCNYDGVNKHPTDIGDGAFVGSNSTLVAPVQIGPGSYVGAGSVITGPVPADALALGRGRQVNKEGWAKQRRETLKKS